MSNYKVAAWFPRNPLLSAKDAEDEASRQSKLCWNLPKDKRGAFLKNLETTYAEMLSDKLEGVAPAVSDDPPPRPLKRANADVQLVVPTGCVPLVSNSQRYVPTQDEIDKAFRLHMEMFAYSTNGDLCQIKLAYHAWLKSRGELRHQDE